MSGSFEETIIGTVVFISPGCIPPPPPGNSTSISTGGAVFLCFSPRLF